MLRFYRSIEPLRVGRETCIYPIQGISPREELWKIHLYRYDVFVAVSHVQIINPLNFLLLPSLFTPARSLFQ